MRLPKARGPLSQALISALRDEAEVPARTAPADEEDLQLALWVLYELHYRGFEEVDSDLEWDPAFLAVRRQLEGRFESDLRRRTADLTEHARSTGGTTADMLRAVVAGDGSGLPGFLQREATADQYRAYLALRSIYHLKESDPQAWVIPRVSGAVKAALAELQYDEYGDGSGDRVHQELFAVALLDAGLDPSYGAYVDRAPAHVLAESNLMSLLGLHRRLRGAALGHLAAFEMTSSLPCRRYAQGASRLGMTSAAAYYEEHVEADAVHEQIALHAICGTLLDAEPELLEDVLFGAAACMVLEEESSTRLLAEWNAGGSGLRAEKDQDQGTTRSAQVAGSGVIVAALLAFLFALTGCSVTAAAPASRSDWRSETDKALAGAVSTLGTAQLLLQHQARGALPQNYVVVALRDAQSTLGSDSSSFRSIQPPRADAAQHRVAVAALSRAADVLNSATTAAAQDGSARTAALRAVEQESRSLAKLQKQMSGP